MGTFYNQGEYWGEITDHGLSPSKRTKTDQIVVRFIVKGLVDNDDPSKYVPADEEYERPAYQAITKKTHDAGMVQQTMDGLEFVGSFESFNRDGVLVGQSRKFYCKHDSYNGEIREQWSVSSGGVVLERIDDNAAKKLDRLFGIQAEAKPPTAEPTPTPPPVNTSDSAAVAAETDGKSDIPF